MKKSNYSKLSLYFLFFFIFVSSCGGNSLKKKSLKEPKWIQNPFIHNYYVGVGSAITIKDAKDNAIADLSKNISSNVKVNDVFSKSYNSDIGKLTEIKKIKIDIKSKQQLTDIEEAGHWYNKEYDIYWYRVKIRKQIADNLFKLNFAEDIYNRAKWSDEGIKLKIEKIETAINLLDEINFNILSKFSKRNYLQKYNTLKDELSKNIKEEGSILVSVKDMSYKIKKEILSKMMVHLPFGQININCESKDECIKKALDNGYKKLFLINPKIDKKEQDMFWKGSLKFSLEYYNFNDSNNVKDKIETLEERGFGTYEDTIHWDEIIKKTLKQKDTVNFFKKF